VTANVKTRLFLILFFAGFAGIASFLLVDLTAVIALIPRSSEADVPAITPAIKVLSLIQPTVLLLAAVLIGIAVAPRVGLYAPVAESLAAGERVLPPLGPQVVPGVVGAMIGALTILLTAAVFKPFLTFQTVERISSFQQLMPIPTRLLYGGITEELLLRWGFMTLVVWITWRAFEKRAVRPTRICFIVAILTSSLIFAVGHLPIAVMLGETTVAVILFVIIANSAFGFIAGYLYWKWGLESAIIAHMLGHVLLALASAAGAYF
jgi:hypothetical protein